MCSDRSEGDARPPRTPEPPTHVPLVLVRHMMQGWAPRGGLCAIGGEIESGARFQAGRAGENGQPLHHSRVRWWTCTRSTRGRRCYIYSAPPDLSPNEDRSWMIENWGERKDPVDDQATARSGGPSPKPPNPKPPTPVPLTLVRHMMQGQAHRKGLLALPKPSRCRGEIDGHKTSERAGRGGFFINSRGGDLREKHRRDQ